MTHLPFEFDEIGYWSELKLEIVEKYGRAYTTAFKRNLSLKKFYIDGFSGAGRHVSKRTSPASCTLTQGRWRLLTRSRDGMGAGGWAIFSH